MGLFNKFKKADKPSPAEEDLAGAKEEFENGEYIECLRKLAWGFQKDVDHLPLYELSARTLENLGGSEEKELFMAVVNDPNDANAYAQLGNFYYEQGHYDLAGTFFEKTLQLDKKFEDVKHSLAISYARRFQIPKAIKVLNDSDPTDFWNIYFLNKCKMLDKQTLGVRESIMELQNFLDQQKDPESVAVAKMKVEELRETLDRLYSVSNLQDHIRDWHYIQYGGVILDYFEDSEDYVAGGRYVASWGSAESIKSLAIKLKQLLDKLSISFSTVCALPDRDSEIVGRVIAKELGINFTVYDPALLNENCLIVSSDTKYFQDYEEINNIVNGQVIFAANHSWLDNDMVSPDIIGFMTQSYSFPWNGGGFKMIDPEKEEFEKTPADDRSPEEIAEDIYLIKADAENMEEHAAFYLEHKDHLKGIGRSAGSWRYNFTIESPVPGSYFM
jgi:tetratricopeptide (TPR) repeat protein